MWVVRAPTLDPWPRALEAYPLDADLTPSVSSTGFASTFVRAGFKAVARRVPPRPIMRHDLMAITHLVGKDSQSWA
jgi:hypothetical protein